MSDSSTPTTQRKFLSVEDFVVQTGISDATVRRWLKRGKLPHVQPAGRHSRILIPADALERMAKAEVVQPTPAPVTPTVTETTPPRRQRGPAPEWMRKLGKLAA